MKKLLKMGMALLMYFNINCQNDINYDEDEFDVPDIIEIKGIDPTDFITELNQEIKFIIENDTVSAKVVELDNNLCPSNPGIICIAAGYLIATFAINCKEEKDTVELKYGKYPSADNYWIAENDSVTITFNNFTCILFLVKAEYYNKLH